MSRFPTLDIDRDGDVGEPPAMRSLKSWLSSAAIHLAFLLLLVLWSIPIVENGTLDLTAFLGDEATEELDQISFVTEESDLEAEIEEAAPQDITVPITESSFTEPELEQSVEPTKEVVAEPLALLNRIDSAAPSTTVPSTINGTGDVADAESVEAAVDRVTDGIRGALGESDVLVVWLLDASLSLKNDRKRVARRLEDFLSSVSATSSQHQIRNAVASFGRRFGQRVAPTQNTSTVLKAIEHAPVDKTGVENVFAAVGKCAQMYRRQWKKNLMIVVWTDESGDDVKLLNKTIDLCNRAKVSVSVVGPSSVLGAETGLHVYVDPKTRRRQQLPVQRGPDSAIPERIRLPYWYPTGSRVWLAWRNGVSLQGSWAGGDYLEGIASSFSPYSLTRLAIETGGSYTIFDRPNDRAPYDFEAMKEYAPDYGSLTDYKDSLSRHPLQLAIHKAVQFSTKVKMRPPPRTFFTAKAANGSTYYPYLTASQFATKLKVSLPKFDRLGQQYGNHVEKALALVSAGGRVENGGMASEYAQEESPRWRAWYDLTRGRLLACSVRATEYRSTIAKLAKQRLRKGTNSVNLLQTKELLSNSNEVNERVEEATMLLERCARENENTPWEYLARAELADGLGLRIIQRELVRIESSKRTPKPQSTPKL